MEGGGNTVILTCIGIYLAVCIGVGLWALRRTKSTQDFFMRGGIWGSSSPPWPSSRARCRASASSAVQASSTAWA